MDGDSLAIGRSTLLATSKSKKEPASVPQFCAQNFALSLVAATVSLMASLHGNPVNTGDFVDETAIMISPSQDKFISPRCFFALNSSNNSESSTCCGRNFRLLKETHFLCMTE